MLEPVTTFDVVYSDPDATAVTWEETRRVLESAELFWITTVRADGRPHVTPVVAAWAEEAIWFSTGVDEQKFANLDSNSHVVLTTGCNRWESGLDVIVEGDAVHVTDDVVLGRITESFSNKWDGRWWFSARDGRFRGADGSGGAEVFAVGATAHRFPRDS